MVCRQLLNAIWASIISVRAQRSGYTLIELAISITVLAILMAGGLQFISTRQDSSKEAVTYTHMQAIQEAIHRYVERNDALPCPASLNAWEIDNRNGPFGQSVTSPLKICTGTGIISNTGAVPTRTLELPDSYAYDGWGKKFTYRVADGLANALYFASPLIRGNIRVTHATYGSERTDFGYLGESGDGAAYVLVSHGSNQRGAWTRNPPLGFSPSLPSNPMEYRNAAHTDPTIVYAQGQTSKYFDDILWFETKTSLERLMHHEAPFVPPPSTCSSAAFILQHGVPTLLDVTISRNALYDSASAIARLCAHPPDVCRRNPMVVQPDSLILWLDGTDPSAGNGMAGGSRVDSWHDKSGKHNDHDAAGGGQATYQTNLAWFQDKSAVHLADDGNLFFQRKKWLTLNGPAEGLTLFMVVLWQDDGTFSDADILRLSSGPQDTVLSISKQTGSTGEARTFLRTTNPGNTASILVPNYTSPMPLLVTLRIDQSSTSWNQGVHMFVYTADGTYIEDRSLQQAVMGGQISSALGRGLPGGYVAEVVGYKRSLSDDERQSVEGYLLRRWFSGECS